MIGIRIERGICVIFKQRLDEEQAEEQDAERGEQHHRDDVVDELRVLDHQHRAGLHAVDDHGGEQHRAGREPGSRARAPE
jgi:hypothetical protein